MQRLDRSDPKHEIPASLAYREDLWHQVNQLDSSLGGQIRGLLCNRDIPNWPRQFVVKEYRRRPAYREEDLPF